MTHMMFLKPYHIFLFWKVIIHWNFSWNLRAMMKWKILSELMKIKTLKLIKTPDLTSAQNGSVSYTSHNPLFNTNILICRIVNVTWEIFSNQITKYMNNDRFWLNDCFLKKIVSQRHLLWYKKYFFSFIPCKKFIQVWNYMRVSNPWHKFPFVWTVSLRAAVWVYMRWKWLCVRRAIDSACSSNDSGEVQLFVFICVRDRKRGWAADRQRETVHAAVMTVVRCSSLCVLEPRLGALVSPWGVHRLIPQ